ncbi:helix-turn-helix domain-containing protein [Streptomyces sp. A0592]|uniref:helix-turn-helix domain-containing protein n=1 Tax=Streptomyces sp. A0592 TaxID=2563099 RepID=UPI00109EB9F5|nr:helix-turn-helix domain-containing protein [Streptomyces sp. A0592]THA83155.1 helix-turn-helix domain-containing protein [Streptomyces sp. A0592]
MSHDARAWVWDHSRSKGTARLILVLIADRCVDDRCIAYASVTALMKRANASRSAVRAALDKLIASGELVWLDDRQGPRGERYYHLPDAARFLAEQALEGERIPTPAGSESGPAKPLVGGPETGPGERNPTPGGNGIRPGRGPESDPQNSSEPKVNGSKSSSSSPLIPAAQWRIDDATQAWLRQQGHFDRLGEHALRAADEKWRTYRTVWAPRTAGAWSADWREWITRERTPAAGRPYLRSLPGGGASTAPAAGKTRAEQHATALLNALTELEARNTPTGTE